MGDASRDMASQKSPLLLRKSSAVSRGKRRRSKLLSLGRWDWSYDTAPPQFDPPPVPSSPLNAPDDKSVDFSQDIMFKVVKTIGFGRVVERIAMISVRTRTVSVSLMFENRIPCSYISRLTPKGECQLELKASRGSRPYTRLLTFVKCVPRHATH